MSDGASGRPRRQRDRFIAALVDAWQCLAEAPLLRIGRLVEALRRTPDDVPALVSVPIATYDRIGILAARTIPSILAQTHALVEVVVVADGTPEELLQPLRDLDDPRVRIHRLRRRTRYPDDPHERWMVAGTRPRSVAARRSRGRWLLWISDDDVLLPDAVATLLAAAEAAGPSVESVFGAYRSGTARSRIVMPTDGIEAVGFPATGPPAWLVNRRLRLFRWNRQSWRRRTHRPCDYDLFRRMRRAGVRFTTTDQVVALQPDVEGTDRPGRQGALLAANRHR